MHNEKMMASLYAIKIMHIAIQMVQRETIKILATKNPTFHNFKLGFYNLRNTLLWRIINS